MEVLDCKIVRKHFCSAKLTNKCQIEEIKTDDKNIPRGEQDFFHVIWPSLGPPLLQTLGLLFSQVSGE